MSNKYEKDGIVFELFPSDSAFLTDDHIASNDKMYITIQCNFIIDYIWE